MEIQVISPNMVTRSTNYPKTVAEDDETFMNARRQNATEMARA